MSDVYRVGEIVYRRKKLHVGSVYVTARKEALCSVVKICDTRVLIKASNQMTEWVRYSEIRKIPQDALRIGDSVMILDGRGAVMPFVRWSSAMTERIGVYGTIAGVVYRNGKAEAYLVNDGSRGEIHTYQKDWIMSATDFDKIDDFISEYT